MKPALVTLSPMRRVWVRFIHQRRAFVSLVFFTILFVLSLGAELISYDKPVLIRYQGEFYSPLVTDYSERFFGGDFDTPADYHDPWLVKHFDTSKADVYWPLNPFSFNTIDYSQAEPNPAPPSARHWLGTDDRGRDIFARLLYGFRVSVLFAFALTAIGTFFGVVAGAIQGYFGGYLDLTLQRLIEIWGSLPELYLLILFASLFQPSLILLLILLSLFGWMGLSDYVRGEFLKNRQREYVLAARALGLSNLQIMWRHVLPNSLTPVITFLPFRISGSILALTSLDFLGLGVPSETASLGELLAQGKENLEAWWISLSVFLVLTCTLLLLIFIGEGLRDALDTRKA